MSTAIQDNPVTLEQLVQSLDAMQIAQLSAFALDIPQLYLCREYLETDEQVAINECVKRLEKGLSEQLFTLQVLTTLLVERDYFESEEARLRLAPEPDFEDLA